jgi:hypothetical protein
MSNEALATQAVGQVLGELGVQGEQFQLQRVMAKSDADFLLRSDRVRGAVCCLPGQVSILITRVDEQEVHELHRRLIKVC